MAKRNGGSPRAMLEQRVEDVVTNSMMLSLGNNRYKVESQPEPRKYYDVNYREYW